MRQFGLIKEQRSNALTTHPIVLMITLAIVTLAIVTLAMVTRLAHKRSALQTSRITQVNILEILPRQLVFLSPILSVVSILLLEEKGDYLQLQIDLILLKVYLKFQ